MMKDKHYHYLFGFFTGNGIGCHIYKVNKSVSRKIIQEINEDISKQNGTQCNVFTISKLECDCDDS